MLNDPAVSSVLTQLSRLARAPMTGAERDLRGKALLTGDVTLESITASVNRGGPSWSREQAAEHGIDVELWVEALHIADVARSESIGVLIERLHRAEAVAEILKAGYKQGRGHGGRLVWSVR